MFVVLMLNDLKYRYKLAINVPKFVLGCIFHCCNNASAGDFLQIMVSD